MSGASSARTTTLRRSGELGVHLGDGHAVEEAEGAQAALRLEHAVAGRAARPPSPPARAGPPSSRVRSRPATTTWSTRGRRPGRHPEHHGRLRAVLGERHLRRDVRLQVAGVAIGGEHGVAVASEVAHAVGPPSRRRSSCGRALRGQRLRALHAQRSTACAGPGRARKTTGRSPAAVRHLRLHAGGGVARAPRGRAPARAHPRATAASSERLARARAGSAGARPSVSSPSTRTEATGASGPGSTS